MQYVVCSMIQFRYFKKLESTYCRYDYKSGGTYNVVSSNGYLSIWFLVEWKQYQIYPITQSQYQSQYIRPQYPNNPIPIPIFIFPLKFAVLEQFWDCKIKNRLGRTLFFGFRTILSILLTLKWWISVTLTQKMSSIIKNFRFSPNLHILGLPNIWNPIPNYNPNIKNTPNQYTQ